VLTVDGSAISSSSSSKYFPFDIPEMKSKRPNPSDENYYHAKSRRANDPANTPDTRTQLSLQLQTDAEASTQSYVRLTDLPTEILLHVFSCISKRDLINMATVCRRCYVVSNDRSLWRELTFTGSTPTTETVRLLLRKSPDLRYLKMVDRTDATAIIEQVCRSNEKLRTLIIERCTGEPRKLSINDGVICNLPKRCRDLKNLTIKRTYINRIKFYNILSQTLPNLKKVDFSVRSGALAIFERTCKKL